MINFRIIRRRKTIWIIVLLIFSFSSCTFALEGREPADEQFNVSIAPFNVIQPLIPTPANTSGKTPPTDTTRVWSERGLSLNISKVTFGYNSGGRGYYDIEYTLLGDLHAALPTNYNGLCSRSVYFFINSTPIYPYATGDVYYDDSGTLNREIMYDYKSTLVRTSRIYTNSTDPLKLDVKVQGNTYYITDYSSVRQFMSIINYSSSQIINLNIAPNISPQISTQFLNDKESNSFTFTGRAWDQDGDGFTVETDISGLKKTKVFLPNSVKSDPGVSNFSITYLSNELSDMATTARIKIYDTYNDSVTHSWPIYIDRITPKLTVGNSLPIAATTGKATILSDDYGKVYLVPDSKHFNTYVDILSLVSQGKAYDLGFIGPNTETHFSLPSSANGSFRAYIIDRGNNVSSASALPILVDGAKPNLMKIVIEDNKIKLIYDEVINSAPVLDDFFIGSTNSTAKAITVIADEEFVNYEFVFDDFEKDTKNADRFLFSKFTNNMFTNTNGTPNIIGDKPTTNTKLSHVGLYTLEYQAQDKPIDNSRFEDGYYKWSDKTLIDLLVHRRPLASISYDTIQRSADGKWTQDNIKGSGHDLDHMDLANRGVVEEKWEYKLEKEGPFIVGKIPSPNLLSFKTSTGADSNYIVRYTVKDVEGAWSLPALQTITLTDKAPITIDTVLDPTFPNSVSPGDIISVISTVYSPLPVTSVIGKLNNTNQVNMIKQSQNGDISVWRTEYLVEKSTAIGTYNFDSIATNSIGTSANDTDKVKVDNSLILNNIRIWGDWNHWRGQLDKITKQTLPNNPHRFLTHENIHIEADIIGNPDSVTVSMSPQLANYVYTNKQNITYRHDSFGYSLRAHPLGMSSGNQVNYATEYVIPLCDWTLGYDNIRKRAPYTITVTARKGATVVTFDVTDIEITGNIHDTTYLAPSN